MKPRMPKELSRTARKGETLLVGWFLRPGSCAPNKEPFCAFHTPEEPDRVSCILHGDTLQITAPAWPEFDGRMVQLDTGAYDVRSMHENLPTYAVFLDTNESVPIGDLPVDPAFAWRLVEESKIFSRTR